MGSDSKGSAGRAGRRNGWTARLLNVEIREAGLDDVEFLAHIGSSSFREAYGAHSNSADLEVHIKEYFSAAAVRSELTVGHSRYFLAMVGADPGGMLKYRKAKCPVPGGDSNAVEIQQLYVLATMQRHGLGRQLTQRIFAFAEQCDTVGVWLSAWKFADWATRFYERVGFSTIGEVEFKLGATTYTDLLMWRPVEKQAGGEISNG